VFSKFKINTLRFDKKEKDFFHFLSMLSDEGGSVLDVGANIGIMTYHLAKSLPLTTIHSFEPMPQNVTVLKRIIANFNLNNVVLHELALGDSSGTVQMILPNQGKTKMQGLSHVKHESITEWNDGEEFDVPLDTLDNLMGKEKVQGIKIDVENFEYFALKGAQKLLDENHPVIYAELWENENRANCFSLLHELGYTPYVVNHNRLIKFVASRHTAQNFIFKAN
jgi:FkbM family methyltransferase